MGPMYETEEYIEYLDEHGEPLCSIKLGDKAISIPREAVWLRLKLVVNGN